MDFQKLLRFAAAHDASDVHLQAGAPAHLRVGGILRAADAPPDTDEEIRQFVSSIVPARLRDNLDERLIPGLDFSYAAPGICRFRCSAYRQLGEAGNSMRLTEVAHAPPPEPSVAKHEPAI